MSRVRGVVLVAAVCVGLLAGCAGKGKNDVKSTMSPQEESAYKAKQMGNMQSKAAPSTSTGAPKASTGK